MKTYFYSFALLLFLFVSKTRKATLLPLDLKKAHHQKYQVNSVKFGFIFQTVMKEMKIPVKDVTR